MSSGVVYNSLCGRVEVGGDPGVQPSVGKERGDLVGSTHLVVHRKFGQGQPFWPVVLEVVDVASQVLFHHCVQALRLTIRLQVVW